MTAHKKLTKVFVILEELVEPKQGVDLELLLK